MLRDATQLTGSVTFDNRRNRLGSTHLFAALRPHETRSLQSGAAALGRLRELRWLVGSFYQDVDRNYGQSLPTPGYDAITSRIDDVVSTGLNAPPDTPYYSNLTYSLKQYAFFGEGTGSSRRMGPHRRAALLQLRGRSGSQLRRLLRRPHAARRHPGKVDSDGVSPR